MSECRRLGKWFRGCSFKPRYESGPPDVRVKAWGPEAVDMLKAMRTQRYVRDVCVTCGKTIEREK